MVPVAQALPLLLAKVTLLAPLPRSRTELALSVRAPRPCVGVVPDTVPSLRPPVLKVPPARVSGTLLPMRLVLVPLELVSSSVPPGFRTMAPVLASRGVVDPALSRLRRTPVTVVVPV